MNAFDSRLRRMQVQFLNCKRVFAMSRLLAFAALASAASIFVSEGCAKGEAEASPKSDAAPGHSFKVDVNGGVPQLFMDGQPVRSRIFWGNTMWNGGVVKISSSWQDVSFEFTSPENCSFAALHLRVGEKPGNVWLEKVEIKDLSDGKTVKDCRFDCDADAFKKDWGYWCEGKSKLKRSPLLAEPGNSPSGGALRISLDGSAEALNGFHAFLQSINVEKGHVYRVDLRVKADSDRVFRPSIHHQKGDYHSLGGLPSTIQSQVKLAAAEGVNLVSFYVNAVWAEPGKEPDFSQIDRICREILDANPNALLIPRINMRAPDWWGHAHPDDMMLFDNGSKGWSASVASELYRRDAVQALKLAIRRCESEFGPHMAGYHPAGGNSDEWFYVDTWKKPLNGYDKASVSAWRAWLRAKYGSDDALKNAWKDQAAILSLAEIPSSEERRGDPKEALRDLAKGSKTADFADFQQESMSDMVLTLAKAVREEAGRDRLCLFFYGYLFEFAGVWNGPATSGHYALRRLLDSPDIDILCSPISYNDRQIGGGATSMTAAESVMLSGKLWLNEDDTSTYIAYETGNRAPGWNDGALNLEDSVFLLRRDLATETCRNFGTWWMDLGGSGWFNDPELWRQMGLFKRMEEDFLSKPCPFRPEVAAVVDERSMRRLLSAGGAPNATGSLMASGRAALNRLGAPYGQYLLDDVAAGRTDAKLNVFLSAFALDAKTRKSLRSLSEKSSSIWCWAPGYLDLDKGAFSKEAVEELTGFKVATLEGASLKVRATEAGLAAGLPAEFGPDSSISPVLSPAPKAGDIVLASYATGEPAVVLRPGKTQSLFCGTTSLPASLYRHMARLSGAHLYVDGDANVYANGRYVAVSAAKDGELAVDTGFKGPLWSELDSVPLGEGPVVKLSLKKAETKVIRLGGPK